MAQPFKQSGNYDFLVEAVPSFMQLPNGTFVKDGFTLNRRADTLAVLGKVTDRYGIVQNAELIDAAEQAFKAQGLANYTRKIVVAGDGERLYATYDFRDQTRKLKVGDEVGMRLTVQNSFDGSLRAAFIAGILRLVCKNGAVTTENEVGMTQKHGSQVSVGFVSDALKKAVDSWRKSLDTFNSLSGVIITQLQGYNALARLAKSNVLSGKLLEGIQAIWASPSHREDNERSFYNLYNAVTQYLTHQVEAERPELVTRVSAAVLGALVRAARGGDRFEKLVAPIEVKAEVNPS